jgi:DNA-binding MarR family transcriptional regulator
MQALSRLRDVHPEITALQIQCLLYVAANPGHTQRQLRQAMGLPSSSASRVLSMLGPHGNRGVAAKGLINMTPGVEDRREVTQTLSPKGERLLADLFGDLGFQNGK